MAGTLRDGPERFGCAVVDSPLHCGDQRGWITIRFKDPATEVWFVRDVECGGAWVGALAGSIDLNRVKTSCLTPDFFPYLLAHEFGHALGFNHVSDRSAVMGGHYGATFNQAEQYHARLAYEVGRGRPYCGWPFSARCQSRAFPPVTPRFVVD